MTESRDREEIGVVPVFPLPETVFFPHTSLALHVFEPRYRTMIRDASSDDLRIAVSLLLPGWRDTHETDPPFHRIGTVGRIEDLERLDDGRFMLRLVAEQRVTFEPVATDRPYQLAVARSLPETRADESDAAVQEAKLQLLAAHGALMRELSRKGSQDVVLDDRTPFAAAVNGACSALPIEGWIKQKLLEESDLMHRRERAADLIHQVLETLLRLKATHPTDSSDQNDLN